MAAIKQARSVSIWVISLLAIAFGLLTIKEGGSVVFGNEVALAAAGNYVPFVVWFNFIAGFAYVTAGIGLWLQQRWAIFFGRWHCRGDCAHLCCVGYAYLCR